MRKLAIVAHAFTRQLNAEKLNTTASSKCLEVLSFQRLDEKASWRAVCRRGGELLKPVT
jgi:hypothetical protein